MMMPMTSDSLPAPPTTNRENARIIRPSKAAPLRRISRVDEILSPSPKTVAIRSSVGNMENSEGFFE